MGNRQHATLAAARIKAHAVWNVVVFVLESLVFILIGPSLRGVLHRLGGRDGVGTLVGPAAAIVAAIIVARFAWIVPATYLPRALIQSLRRRDPYPPIGVPLVMSWAGMRGVVSLAAALALPEGFPGRDFILAANFVVILVTVLVQSATLARLIRVLRLDGFTIPQPKSLFEADTRVCMTQAQLAAVQGRVFAPEGTARHPRLLEQYEYRARAAARFSEAENELTGARAGHFRVLLAAVAASRAELFRFYRAGEILDSVLHVLERELDIEELGARRFADA